MQRGNHKVPLLDGIYCTRRGHELWFLLSNSGAIIRH
jgi:hypothetical protein